MEGIAVEYFPNSIDPGINGKIWISFIYNWWQCTRYMWFTFSYVSSIKKLFVPGILVCGMSTVWEDTDGCANQYICALDIYLMTLLQLSYGIIMDRVINAPGCGKNVVDWLNTMYKIYLRG